LQEPVIVTRSLSQRIRKILFLALLSCLVPLLTMAPRAVAQEQPYFVTYSSALEEPGDLEIEFKSVTGKPNGANRFYGGNIELEYGATTWWTTELYLDGTAAANDATVFTGFRWENRFRVLMREHKINPVLYAEFEDINGANKTLREVVGHDGAADLAESNREARKEKEREMELKLILSSNFKGFNLSENIIAEKNLSNAPWEFGYALAVSRPLSLKAKAHKCTFCAQKFTVGAEMYGGLGDRHSFGLNQTSHYAGPEVNWVTPGGTVVSFSPQFGLNDYSVPRLYRLGLNYEIEQLFSFLHKGNNQ
jgi:hypothetical protein